MLMKTYIYSLLAALFFNACTTANHVHYADPNYLEKNQFSSFEVIASSYENEDQIILTDTTKIDNYYSEYYDADDYYDFSYSSRIRRFHRPMWYSGYYGGIYTDYYWYYNDPFYCGSSIYFGYNWRSHYYPYSPYYHNYYYTTYYGGNHHNGYHHHHYSHYPTTYNYTNNLDNNSYSYGHRGSLSSRSSKNLKNYSLNSSTNKQNANSNIHSKYINAY